MIREDDYESMAEGLVREVRSEGLEGKLDGVTGDGAFGARIRRRNKDRQGKSGSYGPGLHETEE